MSVSSGASREKLLLFSTQGSGVQLHHPNSMAILTHRIAQAILEGGQPVRFPDPKCGNKHVRIPLNSLFIAQRKENPSYQLFRASIFGFLVKPGMSSKELQERIENHMEQCTTAPILAWPHANLPTARDIERAWKSDGGEAIDGISRPLLPASLPKALIPVRRT